MPATIRTFDDLNATEQTAAEDAAYVDLLTEIIEGGLRFNDALNADDTQARIDKAGARAERMQTPWFWAEYIADDAELVETLRGIASATAQDSLYPAPDQNVIRLGR